MTIERKVLLISLSPSTFYAILLGMSTATRHKTSFEIDTAKVAAAKDILGTKTLTDTVDAALSEVVKLRQRRELLKLLSTPGALQLDDPDVMAGAWR
jgi:Arc/MetJ family transcription regulator